MSAVIYHNPRCTKSRQTLALLHERGLEPEIVEYLKSPPSVAKLKEIVSALNVSPQEILRKKEDEYKTLQLADKVLSDNEILKLMHEHPRLIERPIVLVNGKAAIGRPPENVLEIL